MRMVNTTSTLEVEFYGITSSKTIFLQSINGIPYLEGYKAMQHCGNTVEGSLDVLMCLICVCGSSRGRTKPPSSCSGGLGLFLRRQKTDELPITCMWFYH